MKSLPPAATELSLSKLWHNPVESADLLPTDGLRDGQLCLVIEEGSVYEVVHGVWTAMVVGTVILD